MLSSLQTRILFPIGLLYVLLLTILQYKVKVPIMMALYAILLSVGILLVIVYDIDCTSESCPIYSWIKMIGVSGVYLSQMVLTVSAIRVARAS